MRDLGSQRSRRGEPNSQDVQTRQFFSLYVRQPLVDHLEGLSLSIRPWLFLIKYSVGSISYISEDFSPEPRARILLAATQPDKLPTNPANHDHQRRNLATESVLDVFHDSLRRVARHRHGGRRCAVGPARKSQNMCRDVSKRSIPANLHRPADASQLLTAAQVRLRRLGARPARRGRHNRARARNPPVDRAPAELRARRGRRRL